jgi:hypothetical protein
VHLLYRPGHYDVLYPVDGVSKTASEEAGAKVRACPAWSLFDVRTADSLLLSQAGVSTTAAIIEAAKGAGGSSAGSSSSSGSTPKVDAKSKDERKS